MKIGKIQIAAVIAIVGAILIVVNLSNNDSSNSSSETNPRTTVEVPAGQAVATFGTGCFWCMEAAFQQTDGIVAAISGYAGGTVENPTYEQVYTMETDHRESVQVFYDPNTITYSEILDVFWRGIDPTDDGGQFVDRGFAYTTAVFFHNDEQRSIAEASKQELAMSERFQSYDIVTPIIEFTTFYEAEEYHQDFYLKSPERYNQYEAGSGRDQYREFIWSEIQKEESAQ
jgi:peptide methionine sulfoxide reductase msrA/msrB